MPKLVRRKAICEQVVDATKVKNAEIIRVVTPPVKEAKKETASNGQLTCDDLRDPKRLAAWLGAECNYSEWMNYQKERQLFWVNNPATPYCPTFGPWKPFLLSCFSKLGLKQGTLEARTDALMAKRDEANQVITPIGLGSAIVAEYLTADREPTKEELRYINSHAHANARTIANKLGLATAKIVDMQKLAKVKVSQANRKL